MHLRTSTHTGVYTKQVSFRAACGSRMAQMERLHNPDLTRRDCLIRLAAGAACCAGGSLLSDINALAAPRRPLNVIVVGAGMAGLCAAYELEMRGHSVTILEADRKAVGGRVRTQRFADGQYGELGAMRIPKNHHLTRHYIARFGLALRPFVQYNPEAYYYVHGIRKRNRQISHPNKAYTLGMDGRSGSEWSQSFDEIVGGMDGLTNAFVSRLKSTPKTGCVVNRIWQDPLHNRVSAYYIDHNNSASRSAGGLEERKIVGDLLLCTLPAPLVRKLKVEPPLSPVKRRAIAEVPYLGASKVLAQTARRFWETDDHIFGGGTYTDLPTEFTYYPSDNAQQKDARVSAGPGVLVASYTIGRSALRYAALSSQEMSASVLRTVGRVHPQLNATGAVRSAVSWSWDNHPWSLGGFAAPGKRMDLRTQLAAREGRVFFAGEHTSQHRTWIQGALESALLAVRAMLA